MLCHRYQPACRCGDACDVGAARRSGRGASSQLAALVAAVLTLAQVVLTDLVGALEARLTGGIDLLLFNPPYVPSPIDEVREHATPPSPRPHAQRPPCRLAAPVFLRRGQEAPADAWWWTASWLACQRCCLRKGCSTWWRLPTTTCPTCFAACVTWAWMHAYVWSALRTRNGCTLSVQDERQRRACIFESDPSLDLRSSSKSLNETMRTIVMVGMLGSSVCIHLVVGRRSVVSRVGSRSLRIAVSSIWRTRSRVMPYVEPTSRRVMARPFCVNARP